MDSRFRLPHSLSAIFVLFFLLAESPAQLPGSKPEPAISGTPDYSKEALVFESNRTKVTYQEDGSDTREQTSVIRVLSQAGVQRLAVLTFPYTSANETVEFDYVRVRKPDGTVVTTPDYNVQDMPADVTRGAPMYSDLHEKHVTVKALGIGDTLEYLVRYRTLKPQVPGQFWLAYSFATDAIVKDEELKVNVPQNKYAKVASPNLLPQTKDEGGRRIYTWKKANLERKEPDKTVLNTEAPKPSVQVTTFRTWEEVGRWYGELQRSQVVVTPPIQAKAAELTKGLTRDEDKIRALYDFVSTRYHYVSLSFGIGRYQPHPAEDVLENEYGDCKDKHTLLAALLKAAGYDAWPVLISATTKIDPDVPSPGQFDHLITVVPQGNTLLWLDTTPGVAPFGMLMSNLRDKQALVMPTSKPAVLMMTPANPPFPTLLTYAADGKLSSDGTFAGHMQSTARGDVEIIDRLVFRQYSAAQWKDVVQQVSYQWGFAGDVSSVTASNPEDTKSPFEFGYDYKREKIGDWDNRRFNAPLPPLGVEPASVEKNRPEQPVVLGAPGVSLYKVRIEMPAGSTVKLPDKVDLSEDFADFHASYAFKDGVFTGTRQLIIKKKEVPLAEWETYQKFAKAVSDDHGAWIEVTSPWDFTLRSNTAPTEQSQDADQAFKRGQDALKRGDLSDAENAFKLALYMNPSYQQAHANLGMVELRRGNEELAIEEFRKEEQLNPDEPYAYTMLARLLASKDDTAGASEQLQKLLQMDPKNRDAALNLAQLLDKGKRYSEAVQVLKQAAEQSPDSEALQYRLGYAYIQNGEKDKGLAVLQQALSTETDAARSCDELNSVAYSLIEIDTGFDVAKQYAEKALQQQEAASLKVGTGHDGLRNTSSLGATWDTVGWLYFRLGQYDRALPYLKASWLLSQNSEVGDHLGQLYAKLGKKQEAAQTYRLAEAALGLHVGLPNNPEVLRRIKEHYQDLMGPGANPSLFTTSRKADGSFTPTPSEDLSRMRMVKITTTSHPSAHGTISIVFSPGKVEEVTLVDGDESLKALLDRVKAAKFNVEFPDQVQVRLVRRGIVSCGSLGCDLTLILPDNRSLMAVE